MKKRYYEEDYEDDFPTVEVEENLEPEFGCGFCWDKRKQVNKELFFFDAANNMRICKYCPNCGRTL